MELPLVQILVVVANTQMRTLWIEAEKVFTRTVIVRELASPKSRPNSLDLPLVG